MIKKKNFFKLKLGHLNDADHRSDRTGWRRSKNGVFWTCTRTLRMRPQGKELPAEVYALSAAGSAGELDAESGGDAWWSSTATWDEPTWWSSPTWWTDEWSEPELTSKEQKQVDETDAAYEDKVRTFVQARTLMKDKARNRGFYQAAKGKGKASKGKGKGKGSTPTLAAASPTFMAVKGSKGKAKGPNYTGCFI